MSDVSILFSRNSDEWGTPEDIIADLGSTHDIGVDTACRSTNAKYPTALAIDRGLNGLKIPWNELKVVKQEGKACFVNPPHSKIVDWVKKSVHESRRGVRVIMLIPASTGTYHWHHIILPNAVEIQEVEGRINFFGKIKVRNQPKDLPKEQIKYEMGYAPATFDSAVVIFDNSRPRAPQGRPWRTEYVQPKSRKKTLSEEE